MSNEETDQPKDLTALEREAYELIERSGEMMTIDVPSAMRGVIPGLVNKDLVEVVKRFTSQRKRRKRKFLRVRESDASARRGESRALA